MTHLRIEQNNNVEVVNASLIQKLYETAIESSDVTLSGNLQCMNCKQPAYEYLMGNIENNVRRFPNLNINVTDSIYMYFEDPNVESILVTNFGDGVGIKLNTVATISSFNDKFNGSNITSFDELSQFTNITTINKNNRFNDCASLTSINLKNIIKVSGKNGYQRWNFQGCTSLTNIGDTSNITYVGQAAFQYCPLQGVIDFSNVTEFGNLSLYQNSNATTKADFSQCTIDPSKITFIGEHAFDKCDSFSALSTINFPNLKNYSQEGQNSALVRAFEGCTQIEHVINLGKITEIGSKFNDGCFNGCDNLLDVTLPETLTKVMNSAIGSRPKLKYVKILATSLPEYNTLDINGNTRPYGIAFGEKYRNNDVTNEYQGSTYPIYVQDNLLSQYQADSIWSVVGPGRLRPLSQFATDFPNG